MIPDWSTLSRAWAAFFFAPESVATIAVVRVLLGAILVANALLLAREAPLWIGPRGVLSTGHHRALLARHRFSLLTFLPPTLGSVRFVVWGNVVASTGVLVGLFTPLSAGLTFLFLTTIHMRNPYMCHAGDMVLRLMTLLLAVSPAGAMLSLDQALWHEASGAVARAPWGTRLMQLQLSIIYFRAFQCKLAGSTWWDGTAAYYAATGLDYQRFAAPAAVLRPAPVRLATWGTLALEAALGPAIWLKELRYPLIVAGVGMHLVFEYFINIQLFGPTMIALLLLFVPPGDMEALLRALHLL
ncbi:HTTM domain-containing protein [Sorangium sp. So ce861]|uniref:HTTM domain-containing protein n=1 Tax=Sorangium sp. So ce861 TaxID=3133323 RepID=UPI003F60A653